MTAQGIVTVFSAELAIVNVPGKSTPFPLFDFSNECLEQHDVAIFGFKRCQYLFSHRLLFDLAVAYFHFKFT